MHVPNLPPQSSVVGPALSSALLSEMLPDLDQSLDDLRLDWEESPFPGGSPLESIMSDIPIGSPSSPLDDGIEQYLIRGQQDRGQPDQQDLPHDSISQTGKQIHLTQS